MEDFGFKRIDPTARSVQHEDDNSSESEKKTGEKKGMNKRSKKRFFKTKKFIIPFVLFIFILILGVFVGIKGIGIYKDAKVVQAQGKEALAAMKQNNIIEARAALVKTKEKVKVLKADVQSIAFLGYIPFLGGYVNDLQHTVNAGEDGIDAGIIAADAVIPYADVLGLKGEGSFAMGSAEDRIRLTVKTMGKVVPKIDEIEVKLKNAQKEVDQIDPNRYPNFGPFKKVRTQLMTVKALVNEGVLAVDQGKPLIKVLPELLGESGEKKYLVLFQNDAEQRSTGGFLTYYAIFRVDQGVIKVNNASDIYFLDDSIANHPVAPEIISKYLPKVNKFYIRDSNLSPDFYESMQTFKGFYEKSGKYEKIDGIIAIDTKLLVHILNILEDVEVGGVKFTSQNDPRCNCPQVVYVLEDSSTRPVGYLKSNRKSLVGDLLYAIMEKALKSPPRQYWARLFQQGIQDIQEKHVLFYMYNSEAQKGVEALNWGGRINQKFDGDYLHINDSNFGGQKSNMFVKTDVKIEYTRAGNGEITKTITEVYKNPEKYSDCGLESGGLCLNATLRNFQRVYVPKGSTLESSKGSQVKVETIQDLGRTVFESFFTVNPLGRAQMTYTYKLPFKVAGGSSMPVLIQKQPGLDAVPYEIYVNGKKIESFNLVTDKEFSIKF